MTPVQVQSIHALTRLPPLAQITAISPSEIAALAITIAGDDFVQACTVLQAFSRLCGIDPEAEHADPEITQDTDAVTAAKVIAAASAGATPKYVCGQCGCEVNEDPSKPCMDCESTRVATREVIEVCYGKNWREVFRSMKKGGA